MLRRINFYSICFAFGLSVLLILAGSRYTDNVNYHPSPESRKSYGSFFNTEDGDSSLLQYSQKIQANTDPYEEAIVAILDKTRSKIKHDLSNYNLTLSGVNKLENLTPETGGQPVRSVIVSTWRSGTTFLGEVLNAFPGNFYLYEPLLKYGIIQIRGPPHASSALDTIKRMLKCDFSDMEDFFDYGKTHVFQFNHNLRLWDHCKFKIELCYDPDFTARFCKLFPFQSMKVVRLRLNLIEDLLQDKELNTKVVFLIRDPRAVMESRKHRVFCKPSDDCWMPERLCADMISDYMAAGPLIQKYPDRFIKLPVRAFSESLVFASVRNDMYGDSPVAVPYRLSSATRVLRYEELALSPNVTSYELLKFLRLGPVQAVAEFLHTHTNVESGGYSSTFRVSRDVPFRWKKIMNFTSVEKIQGACEEAMSLWGYKLAHNATHMASKDFYPLEPYSLKS